MAFSKDSLKALRGKKLVSVSQNVFKEQDRLSDMSDFSIDFILNRAGDQYVGTNASIGIIERVKLNQEMQENLQLIRDTQMNHNYEQQIQRSYAANSLRDISDTSLGRIPMFDWLQYTRYHPPKLPRTFRACPAKRTPGRLPRIPFSPAQLQALEEAYKNSNYLSAEDANRLAESLELTNTRVKIWFQNRRARERRERREKNESCLDLESSNASSSEPEDMVVVV